MSILWIAIVAAALIGLNPATWYADPVLESVQTPYQDGAPHTDRQGRALRRYDPARSFFPIAIYHGLDGEFHGRRYSFKDLKTAGFNTVHGWEGQPLAALAAAASEHGLQLIYHNPSDQNVKKWRDNPALMAWYLDEEPTLRAWDPEWEERLEAFVIRRNGIRTLDPARAVFALDTPYIDPPWRERWLRWADAGDVSVHWNYPLKGDGDASLNGRRGVGETVTTAVQAVNGRKPVWLVVQAFASARDGWRMPTEAELRAMVFGGVVHGATGILYFAYDSFVTRDGQVLGVAPTTARDYGDAPDYNKDEEAPLTASTSEQAQSRELWWAITRLNGELAELAPVILSPTAKVAYEVIAARNGAPVRTILKDTGERRVLIAVNMENRGVEVRFRFPDSIGAPKALIGEISNAGSRDWKEVFRPYEVKIFTFEKRPGL